MKTNLSTASDVTTDRPAPYLPGLYMMQALSSDASIPQITQYHRTPEPALRWMKEMAKKKTYDAYALCSSENRWDVFNRHGKAAGTRTQIVPPTGEFAEVNSKVVVAYDAYVTSAREVLGPEVSCITWAQHHLHASSVGHSNMITVAVLMIMDAAEKDLEHIYHVDSIASGCRVQGWFMDVSKVSERLRNQYLDWYERLSKDHPLSNACLLVMAHRMATLRPLQILDILRFVNKRVKLGENIRLVGRRIKQAKPEELIMFATKLFEVIEDAVCVGPPHELEILIADVVAQNANRIAALYRETFLK